MLTRTPIEEVLRTGRADHTPLAKDFLTELESSLGLGARACYLQASTQLVLPEPRPEPLRRDTIPAVFVREEILSVYIHKQKSSPAMGEDFYEKIYSVFHALAERLGQAISYPRLYTPEEMRLYGWNHTPRGQWDFSQVIPEEPPCEHRHTVKIEAIDSLARWNLLSDSLTVLNRLPPLAGSGGRVFCGFDPARQDIAYFVLFPSGSLPAADTDAFREAFQAAALGYLKPRDVWDAITPTAVSPVITTKERLTPEQKFGLARN